MACHAARRIAVLSAVAFLATSAFADWGSAHYCRPTIDRFVIFTGSERFVLTHGGSWELVDPAQKPMFDKWLAQTKLPKDLGQLVAGAPLDHLYLTAGEVDARSGGGSATKLEFKFGQDEPIAIDLTSTSPTEAKPDAKGETAFTGIAKKLKKPAPTLLLLLADTTAKVDEPQAWGKFLARFTDSSEFFVFLDKKQGVLWVRRMFTPTPVATNSTAADQKPSVTDEKPKPKSPDGGGLDPTIPIAGGVGVVCLLIGVALGRSVFGVKQKSKKEEPKFNLSLRERELIQTVRQEGSRLGWEANHVPTSEEFVVEQMTERYRRHDSLLGQIEQLKSYKSFKDDHDSFQKKIDNAVAAAKASETKLSGATAELERARAQAAELVGQLKTAQNEKQDLNLKLGQAQKTIVELERSDTEFQQLYSELITRTAAVCHDILLTRPRGDNWASSFAFVANYSVAYLGVARQCRDQRMFDAMILNLTRLSEAMVKSFPDRKLVIDPWRRAAAAFGEKRAPNYDAKPHPHVDSLSQVMLILRDTGPSLTDFREMFAPSDGGLHIIRPA